MQATVKRFPTAVDNQGMRRATRRIIPIGVAAIAAGLTLASTAAAAVPAAPGKFRITRTATHSISLAWTDRAQNESRYEVLRDGSAKLQAPNNSQSLIDSGLAAGTRHSYRIR